MKGQESHSASHWGAAPPVVDTQRKNQTIIGPSPPQLGSFAIIDDVRIGRVSAASNAINFFHAHGNKRGMHLELAQEQVKVIPFHGSSGALPHPMEATPLSFHLHGTFDAFEPTLSPGKKKKMVMGDFRRMSLLSLGRSPERLPRTKHRTS